jgi:hypothetical protein
VNLHFGGCAQQFTGELKLTEQAPSHLRRVLIREFHCQPVKTTFPQCFNLHKSKSRQHLANHGKTFSTNPSWDATLPFHEICTFVCIRGRSRIESLWEQSKVMSTWRLAARKERVTHVWVIPSPPPALLRQPAPRNPRHFEVCKKLDLADCSIRLIFKKGAERFLDHVSAPRGAAAWAGGGLSALSRSSLNLSCLV